MRLLFKTLEPREGTPTFPGSSRRGIWRKAGSVGAQGEVGYLPYLPCGGGWRRAVSPGSEAWVQGRCGTLLGSTPEYTWVCGCLNCFLRLIRLRRKQLKPGLTQRQGRRNGQAQLSLILGGFSGVQRCLRPHASAWAPGGVKEGPRSTGMGSWQKGCLAPFCLPTTPVSSQLLWADLGCYLRWRESGACCKARRACLPRCFQLPPASLPTTGDILSCFWCR